MTQRVRTLGIIPARGGSKGIPRKNIKTFAGRPLIAWTISAAREAKLLDRVIVSTEDEEIAEVARGLGGDVPYLRPANLSRDDTPGVEPVLHALEMLPDFEAAVLLQPTSPLRSAGDIDGCIEAALGRGAPSAVSVTEPDAHPFWMYRLADGGRLEAVIDRPLARRRQDLPPVYALNGAVYFARADWLRTGRSMLGAQTVAYVMPRERSIDLDTPLEWSIAEFLLSNRT